MAWYKVQTFWTKLIFETAHTFNDHKNYHKYRIWKCVSNENFVENKEVEDNKPCLYKSRPNKIMLGNILKHHEICWINMMYVVT